MRGRGICHQADECRRIIQARKNLVRAGQCSAVLRASQNLAASIAHVQAPRCSDVHETLGLYVKRLLRFYGEDQAQAGMLVHPLIGTQHAMRCLSLLHISISRCRLHKFLLFASVLGTVDIFSAQCNFLLGWEFSLLLCCQPTLMKVPLSFLAMLP